MIAIVGSSTLANRLKRSIEKRNIKVALMQTPNKLRSGGCSYSIVFDAKHVKDITQIAKEVNIELRGIYDNIP